MFHTHDSQDAIHISNPFSPDRPPQWKWSTCGYRCGLGCEEPSDEDGDVSRAPTLVGSTPTADSGDEEGIDDSQLFQDARSFFSIDSNEERVEVVLLENVCENEHLSHSNLQLPQDEKDLVDSLAVESCATDDQSVVLSVHGEIEIISPGPGIGSWIENDPRQEMHTGYYFRDTPPLWLSPQYEHCRGDQWPHDEVFLPGRWNEF